VTPARTPFDSVPAVDADGASAPAVEPDIAPAPLPSPARVQPRKPAAPKALDRATTLLPSDF
jgi:hypothetical protein